MQLVVINYLTALVIIHLNEEQIRTSLLTTTLSTNLQKCHFCTSLKCNYKIQNSVMNINTINNKMYLFQNFSIIQVLPH